MGLSTVTPRSFNSTGAQSVCRANQPQPDTPIESQFLTQCNLEYIHGSGESVVRGSLGSLPLETLPSDTLNQDIFYLESDVDAISGMDLTVSLTFPTPESNQDPATGKYPTTNAQKRFPSLVSSVSKDFLLSIINRIEVRVGGLTVQRITPEEIWQRNLTEQDYSSVEQFLNSTIDCRSKLSLGGDQFANTTEAAVLGDPTPDMEEFDDQRIITRGRVLNKNQKQFPISMVREGDRVSWTLSLPVIGRSNDMHRCFLQAGAVSNSITIVVFYNQVIPDAEYQQPQAGAASTKDEYGTRGVSALLRLGKRGGFTKNDRAETNMKQLAGSYQSYLTVRNHTFTNTEADFVQQNIVNRVVTASQCVVREITQNEVVNHSLVETPLTGVSELTGTKTATIAGGGGITANNGQVQATYSAAAGYANLSMCYYGPFKTADSSAPPTITAPPGNIVPQSIKTIQYKSTSLIPITVSLDDIDINTSHLLISAFASTHTSRGDVSVSPLETINCGCQALDVAGTHIVAGFDGSGNPYGSANLARVGGFSHPNTYLRALCKNIYSYSGFSIADNSQNVTPTGMIVRGALTDYVEFIEVIIGSDRTGRMPASALLASNGTFGLTKNDAPIYVVPLADMPFSTAGVPMSRVGTKQVILYVDSRYAIDYGPFTQVDGNINNPQFLYYDKTTLENPATGTPPKVNPSPTTGITKDDLIVPWAPITKVAVTAVGTQVQTTVGGSTSFAS